MTDYRDNDETRGYCPTCGRELAALDVAGRGVCEEHGRVFADWSPGYQRARDEADNAYREMGERIETEGERIADRMSAELGLDVRYETEPIDVCDA